MERNKVVQYEKYMYMIATEFLSKYRVFGRTVDHDCKIKLEKKKKNWISKKEFALIVGTNSFLKELKKNTAETD